MSEVISKSEIRNPKSASAQPVLQMRRVTKHFATPRGLPITYLIAPDGKLARQFLGPVTAHELENAIEASGGQVR